ncbi:MAG: hypothetical protein GKR93_12060 [Gammaproteobacteria bacterium]|nr:hypothetical protein [Gammaproteobacteria bacterium]
MNPLDTVRQQGRLDGLSGLENKSNYRRRDKRLAYAQGHREGAMERTQSEAHNSISDMSDDERQRVRDKLRKLRESLSE